MSVEFCDTNVLAYAHSASEHGKRRRARELTERLWHAGSGAVSVQVLQELYVVLTRKARPTVPHAIARVAVHNFAAWQVVEPTRLDVLNAIDNAARWQVSLWDAMLLTTANKAQATILWTEDLNEGQRYDAVTVRNPFKDVIGVPRHDGK